MNNADLVLLYLPNMKPDNFIGHLILGRFPFSSCRSNIILYIDASCYSAGSEGLKDEIDAP
jgi:hypothetical protein